MQAPVAYLSTALARGGLVPRKHPPDVSQIGEGGEALGRTLWQLGDGIDDALV
jgi:hypothetical protein